MKAPQIIMIILFGMNIGMNLIKHGEPRTDKYNFWTSALAIIIQFAIMKWGGFF